MFILSLGEIIFVIANVINGKLIDRIKLTVSNQNNRRLSNKMSNVVVVMKWVNIDVSAEKMATMEKGCCGQGEP